MKITISCWILCCSFKVNAVKCEEYINKTNSMDFSTYPLTSLSEDLSNIEANNFDVL